MYRVEGSIGPGTDYVETRDARGDYGDSWLMFAGLMIFFVGLWNAIEGGIALFRSAFFTGQPVFGSLVFWAAVWIGIGVIQMAVAYAIIAGNNIARWIGVVIVGASTIVSMLTLPAFPWWSLFVLAVNLLLLYALLVHGPGRREPAY
jgi:hypothetical protein